MTVCSSTITGHSHPAILSTASGILINNPAGDSFMAAASYGIGKDETIYQTHLPDKTVGKAVVEIPFTDVCLVKLEKCVTFSNKTFEAHSGAIPELTRFLTPEDKLDWPICYLNSPYTGNMEASIVSKSVKLEPSVHPMENNPSYVVYNWAYSSQIEDNSDKIKPPDGTCGL